MAKGDSPRFKLKVKPRTPGAKRLTIASIWQNDKGMTAKLDRDVREVVMRDGTVWTNDNAYFDLFDEQDGRGRAGGGRSAPAPNEAPAPPPGDDDIPFMRPRWQRPGVE